MSTTEDALRDLSASGRHLELAERLASAAQGDGIPSLRLRYCRAIALVEAGRVPEGLSELASAIGGLLNSFDPAQSASIAAFAVECARQLGLLSVFYAPNVKSLDREFETFMPSMTKLSATMLKSLSLRLGDAALADEAKSFDEVVWEGSSDGACVHRFGSPLCLQIEPTNCCNLKCLMCSRRRMKRPRGYISGAVVGLLMDSWSWRRRSVEFTHFVFKTPISKTAKGAVKLFFLGEPLLHPGLPALVERIKSSGASCGVQTNGLLLAKKRFRSALLAAAPDLVSVSIDGVDQASYESIRKGSRWADCRDGLLDFAKERDSLGLAGEVGISLASIVPPNEAEWKSRCENFLSPFSSIASEINFLRLNTTEDPGFVDSSSNAVGFTRSENAEALMACREPFQKLNVLWDGRITPCCSDYDGAIALGCAQDGVDAVWNSKGTIGLQRALMSNAGLPQFCRRCLSSK